MRVINLDETGVKLLNRKKNQIYLTYDEIPEFIAGKYKIEADILKFKDKSLPLSTKDLEDFTNVIHYLKTEIYKG